MRLRFLAVAGIAALAVLVVAGMRAREAMDAYGAVVADVDRVRGVDLYDAAAVGRARTDLLALRSDVERLDNAARVPIGEPLVRALPWVGARYAAAIDVITLARLAAATGVIAADVLSSSESTAANSWLASLAPHLPDLEMVASNVREMERVRSRIDPSVLPDNVRRRLDQFDQLLDRPELQAATAVDIRASFDALGVSRPVRYLVLFQNPAELRPTGGFPGTVALVSIEHGALGAVQFFDVHELTQAYLAQRPTPLQQPWPIERYFPQPEFLLHDATWWPDFPHSAQQIMSMYAQTGWPPIDGVIAVQPEVASSLIRVSGPFTIEFDREKRTITPDNVYDEIERQRRTHLESVAEGTIHKQMLSLIGQTLIERLKTAGRSRMVSALSELAAACQRRDIQAYAADPAVEAELDRQSCTGRLQPLDGQPTLAVTYANLALSKTSLDMRPRLTVHLSPPRSGVREGRLDIDVRDGAVPDEDPIYGGFQRWWVSVALPTGSTLLSDPGPMEDPEAPNGGSYMAAIYPDMTGRINIRFTMPDSASLLVRRQPGVRPGDVHVSVDGCANTFDAELDHDLLVDVTGLCG